MKWLKVCPSMSSSLSFYETMKFPYNSRSCHVLQENQLVITGGVNHEYQSCYYDADTNADLIIDKEAFGSTGLAEYMQKHKDEIGEVEFIGVCTDICVISNVLITKAVLPNKKIYVDAKGCAGVTKQANDTALSAMKACHIKIENEL